MVMKTARFASIGLAFLFGGVVFLPVACSDTGPRPAAVDTDTDGSVAAVDATTKPPVTLDATPPTVQDTGVADSPGDSSSVVDASDEATTTDASDASTKSDAGDAGPTGCSNGILNGTETDVDCGGAVCAKCIDDKACVGNADCTGGFCANNVCKTPTCTDNLTNGNETDVDCGGGTCPKCTYGRRCGGTGDCVSSSCAGTACGCPANMVVVATSAALGGAYCVDQAEVQNGQYNQFLNANQPITGQTAGCGVPLVDGGTADGGTPVNATYVPQGAWPPAQPLSSSFGLPVRYVDWCDAYAYCAWAGKQLCGKIGGKGNSAALTSANDHTQSAWYNACSAQGVNTYPYDVSAFNGPSCNGDGLNGTLPYPDGVFQVASWNDQGAPNGVFVNTQCQGGTVNLFQMSGNVAEWENSCTGGASTDDCRVRGGAYTAADSPPALGCQAGRLETRMAHKADVGFRCCQF